MSIRRAIEVAMLHEQELTRLEAVLGPGQQAADTWAAWSRQAVTTPYSIQQVARMWWQEFTRTGAPPSWAGSP